MLICELISNIYNYFYYSIIKNNESDISEKMLNKTIIYQLCESV